MVRRPPPLTIGPFSVWPPVVLAPMAGVTNPAFRRLCRRFARAGLAPAGSDTPGAPPAGGDGRDPLSGLFVSEMVTARGLVEGGAGSFERAAFDPDETPRSIQLYGADPMAMGQAVRLLVGQGRVDHVDLNMGCPVRKITRHGGGAALTARPRLLAAIVRAAVDAAGPVPVTVKFRLGVDDRTVTYLDSGRAARDEGAAAVALHGRTAAQLYSGTADWDAIARLRESLTGIPVLGNGDIWCADDALAMMGRTGCDGVVIGRGCLGRPWLFQELSAAFAGHPAPEPPESGVIVDILTEHLDLLIERMGPDRAVRDIRKHIGWYLTGYPVGGSTRRALATSASVDDLREGLAGVPRDLAAPAGAAERPRGTQRGPQRVVLPDGWLDDRSSTAVPAAAADVLVSGG